MTLTPLEYAPRTPGHRGRQLLRWALIAVLALAVGLVGQLCWDKFVPAVRDHLAALDAQNDLPAEPSPETVEVNEAGRIVASAQASSSPSAVSRLLYAAGARPFSAQQPVWAGVLLTARGPRTIVLTNDAWASFNRKPPNADPREAHHYLTAFAFTRASWFAPARMLGGGSLLDLGVSPPLSLGPIRVDPNAASQLLIDGADAHGEPLRLVVHLDDNDVPRIDPLR